MVKYGRTEKSAVGFSADNDNIETQYFKQVSPQGDQSKTTMEEMARIVPLPSRHWICIHPLHGLMQSNRTMES